MSAGRRWIAVAPSVTYRDALNAPETKVSTLKNRLRVATQNNGGAGTATVEKFFSHLSQNYLYKVCTRHSNVNMSLNFISIVVWKTIMYFVLVIASVVTISDRISRIAIQ